MLKMFMNHITGVLNLNDRQLQISDKSEDVWRLFEASYKEDPQATIVVLCLSYDIRALGKKARRKTYETILMEMSKRKDYEEQAIKLLYKTPSIGRWSTVIKVAEVANARVASAAFSMIKRGLEADNVLLKKWLPRKGNMASRIRGYLRITPKEYRQMLHN